MTQIFKFLADKDFYKNNIIIAKIITNHVAFDIDSMLQKY